MTESLATILQHDFSDDRVLTRALTHGSADVAEGETYERLEFLGDRVLSLIIADMLLKTFPEDNEGKLARRHAALVRRDTLAAVAADIGLGDFIVMSAGEADAGGRKNPSLLADVCEAVIAAVYIDGGLPAAGLLIERHWRHRMTQSVRPPQDAKTGLQEWAQGRGMPLPVYRIVDRSGPDHAPTFTVSVTVGDGPTANGTGTTRRSAEKAAAEALLKKVRENDR